MARPIRVEFEGAVYHVTARGNERKRIYRDEADRRSFLGTLEEAVEMYGLSLHADCLMPNHSWSSHAVYGGHREAPGWLCTDWLGFFHSKRREAQRQYRRFVADAFGTVMDNPWADLRMGLALGGEALLARVRSIVEAKPGQEEVRWVARVQSGDERKIAARALAEAEPERRWQVWVRVRVGNERRIDVARAYGYKDGSAITQIIKRLEAEAARRSELGVRMSRLRAAFERQMSSVKR
jgi:hypothetical protein